MTQKKTIASFCVDHRGMLPGLYFREDRRRKIPVLTCDVRFFMPNTDALLTTTQAHTIEHLLATVLRAGSYADHILYFGPMGCRTGFYLLTVELCAEQVVHILTHAIQDALTETSVPGAASEQCGNYRDLDLADAQSTLADFLAHVKHLQYKPL